MVLEVDLAAFAAAHADGGCVIDVREPHVYLAGHQRMWNLYLAYSEAGFRADIWTSTSSFWSAGGDRATARPRRTAG